MIGLLLVTYTNKLNTNSFNNTPTDTLISENIDISEQSNANNAKDDAIIYSKYNGWWEDAEYVDDEQLFSNIELKFEPSSNTAELYIVMSWDEPDFMTSTTVTIDDCGIGYFSFTDEINELKGSGTIKLQDKNVKLKIDIPEEENKIAEVYGGERIFIRNPHEGQVFPDPYELLSEITGFKDTENTQLVLNVSESEGFKEWITVISVIKDGKVYRTYKVDTLKCTVIEWN